VHAPNCRILPTQVTPTPESIPKRRLSIVVMVAFGALAAGLLAWWAWPAPAVAAVTLQVAPLVRTLQFSARVAAASRVDLGSTLTGRVLQVSVVEGARVKRGDPLVRLESDELQAALAQALASERQAAARLGGLRSTGRSGAQAVLKQADSVLVAAQADLQRTQELVAQGFLSPARLDESQRAVSVAQAQLAGAQAQRAAIAEQGSDVAQAQAQLALAASATAGARARLAQVLITAPADARVLARLVEPGQIVQPGRALLTLALAGEAQLSAQADERFLEQLQVGQAASVVADAYPAQRFAARVQAIAPLVDAQRGAIEVKFSLPQAPPAFLREDMTLSVEVETARRDATLVVPASALRGDTGAGAASVLIERDGRVEARAVRLGLRTPDAAEVLAGLAAGDTVLLGPAPEPGRRVRADVTAVPRPTTGTLKPSREDAGSAMSNAMGR
jgi:HlyD family secretion protein